MRLAQPLLARPPLVGSVLSLALVRNGPVGIGQNDCVDPAAMAAAESPYAAYTDASSAKATALPSSMAVAASFDRATAAEFATVVADEALAMALHVWEAPGMNLARNPVLGRNFEYKGEDPFLAGTLAAQEIRTVQERGVVAMAKHFAANEQETNRMSVSETIDEQGQPHASNNMPLGTRQIEC